MSKKLRLLLVSLLLVAPSLSLLAQETEEVEAVAPEQEPAESQQTTDTETPSPDEQVAEPEAEQSAPEKTEAQPTETEQAVEPEAPAEEQPAAQEPAERSESTSEKSVQWDPELPAEKAPKQKQDTTPSAPKKYGEDEVMGIDTVDIATPQGNWLYKRVWWERSEAKYERIRETVNKIMEERTRFFAKRAELDKNVLDPFYIKIGISQGELQEILGELLAKVEKLLEGEQNDQMQEKIEADKKSLQDLQKQVQQVVAQDEEVDKAILVLVEQITKIRNIEQQAWQEFKSIARVLDDKKAREHFYKVDAAWRNIKELQNYIEQKFASRFDALVAKVSQEVQRVDQEMNAIKESGIDLKQRLLGAQRAQMEMDEQEQEEEPKGFFTRYITDPLQAVLSGAWSVMSWPYRAIFGAPSEQDEDEQELEATEPEEQADSEVIEQAEEGTKQEPEALKETIQEESAEQGE